MHAATRRSVLAAALVLFVSVAATQAHAADPHSFVLMLGRDTTSVETVAEQGDRMVVDQVGRAPRVMRRHFEYVYSGTELKQFSMRVTPGLDTTATQLVQAVTGPDSITITTRSGAAAPRVTTIAFPKGAMLQPLSSPWAAYERQTRRLSGGKPDSLSGKQLFLGMSEVSNYTLRRLDADSLGLTTDRSDVNHMRVGKKGEILGVLPIAGTSKFGVTRVAPLDLDAMAASFVAREKSGAGLGTLSPRDTVRADASGAALWIDYGRPGKRGRTIYGNVVPYGEVWRTGANAATQFKTDKALSFGGTLLPAGFYSLWTLPSASGWKLIINSETGQWGTDHHADKDIASIDMTLSTLPTEAERFTIGIETSAQGGVLNFDWDTTRASAAFSVAP